MTKRADDSGFDCLEFKERVQSEIYEETKGFSREEFRAYLRKRVEEGPFADSWRELSARKPKRT